MTFSHLMQRLSLLPSLLELWEGIICLHIIITEYHWILSTSATQLACLFTSLKVVRLYKETSAACSALETIDILLLHSSERTERNCKFVRAGLSPSDDIRQWVEKLLYLADLRQWEKLEVCKAVWFFYTKKKKKNEFPFDGSKITVIYSLAFFVSSLSCFLSLLTNTYTYAR